MDQEEIQICKQGWLQKRGEHIKTWRPRYFVLRSDGNFIGYNSQPSSDYLVEPNNTFFIKDCKILTSDKPKNNVFIIRCMGSGKSIIERVFAANNNQEREEWINAIQYVSQKLNGQFVVDISGKAGNKITLHDFEFLKILGKGTFGKVILCRERNTKRICAMKILKKSLIIAKNEIQHTETENKVMRTIKHPFITNLIYSFQTTDRLCLVMEYVNGGELFFHLSREKRFSEDRSRFYCAEISLAIGYLHENNIVYRDIKLENILLDNEGHIKLADFGLCKMNMSYDKTTDTFCGTPEYLAPEILTDASQGGYGRAVDWWAVGVLLYEMLIGRLPFSNNDVKVLFQKIVRDPVEYPMFLSTNARNVLMQLLEKSPSQRLCSSKLDFKEIQMHPFFANINWNDLLEKKIQPPFLPQVSSEIDTRYFEKEFTGESVQLTPPDDDSVMNNLKYFDSFSFYGSKTSLNSQSSIQLLGSNQKYYSNTSLDKYDTSSLLKDIHSLNNSNANGGVFGPMEGICEMPIQANNVSLLPYLIQYTDNRGQLFESQTYIPMSLNESQMFFDNLKLAMTQSYNVHPQYIDPTYLALSNINNQFDAGEMIDLTNAEEKMNE